MKSFIDRFREICKYDPSKGIVTEMTQINTTGWICVGEVPYYPWGKKHSEDKIYIMVNPIKTKKYGKDINEIIYTENNDGSGLQTDSVPSYALDDKIIYPNHQDDEYGELLLGKKEDESVLRSKHQNFISQLFIIQNKIILSHDSSYKITDGVIKKGTPNGWSNNNDKGVYFWGSRNHGNDISNESLYTYYCLIDIKDIYDLETNRDRLSTNQAMKKYKYVGKFWKKGNSIVVTTFHKTPIWRIFNKENGKWYDSKWNETVSPF